MTCDHVTAPVNPVAESDAYKHGVARANEVAASAAPDERIDLEAVVTYRPPAFLTTDYDPTYRPTRIDRNGSFEVTDPDAVAIAAQMVANGTWKRCPECGDPIATGQRIHALCEQARKAGAA